MAPGRSFPCPRTGISLHVPNLYIARLKAKPGITERDCCSRAKTEGDRGPKFPPENERAMEEALRHYQTIP